MSQSHRCCDTVKVERVAATNGGRLVPREDYRISTLNCGEDDFAVACIRSNLRYGKNQKREDVKSHHYIINFDPRDGPDNGLTVDKAQELGERFCREQFTGHQAIVCTHPDGHNQSGNIHVHIVINSLRIENVPLLPYMDRPADTKAGCKHRCTDAAMEYFKSEVMELCHEAGLYQIDLLNGSANRVTECEYWAKKKGQAALDRENAALAAEGKPTQPTRFETDKEKLRQIIRKTLNESFTVEDFARKLGAPKQLPKRKDVVAEIQSLISEKNECYNDYREKSDRLHELMTMQRNYQMAIQPQQPKHGRKHEQEL